MIQAALLSSQVSVIARSKNNESGCLLRLGAGHTLVLSFFQDAESNVTPTANLRPAMSAADGSVIRCLIRERELIAAALVASE